MKSIYEIRLENLVDLIRTTFDNRQVRLAERLEVKASLVSQWYNGRKPIGFSAARMIEAAARKEKNWLDIDHGNDGNKKLPEINRTDEIVAWTLQSWMNENKKFNTEARVAAAAGVSQSTVHRILARDVSPSVAVLVSIASVFGRRVYELMLPVPVRQLLPYGHDAYMNLTQENKDKIKSFMDFIYSQNKSEQSHAE